MITFPSVGFQAGYIYATKTPGISQPLPVEVIVS